MKNQQLKEAYDALQDERPSRIRISFIIFPIYLFSLAAGLVLCLLGGAQLVNDFMFTALLEELKNNDVILNNQQVEALIGLANFFSIVCLSIGLCLFVLVYLTGAIHRRNRYISRQEEVIENLLHEHKISERVAVELKDSLRSIR
ncbi:MAG: hypothetical protein IBJ09_04110 [Bacteroidia bacterium]|nr:hypothetical protein [Bacteroidia bacterium]